MSQGRVESATRAELRARGVALQESAMAVMAVLAAQRLDRPMTDMAFATVSRELRQTLLDLAKTAPQKPEEDGVDDLVARRAARQQAAR